MKQIAGLALVFVVFAPGSAAAASTPVVGVGGAAVGSKGADALACTATIRMVLSELTEDTSPVQVRGKVTVLAEGVCGPTLPVPYATDIHIYAGGVEIFKITCWGSFQCRGTDEPFTVPAGKVLSAASHQWWDLTGGRTWNAATPGLCSIKNPRVFCGAYAAMTP
ncbi:MAG: hypothetical protein HY775_07425 [Acidobacteria bacterium]|nr:hypothetical protein [Acidobacteriota bacterium]